MVFAVSFRVAKTLVIRHFASFQRTAKPLMEAIAYLELVEYLIRGPSLHGRTGKTSGFPIFK